MIITLIRQDVALRRAFYPWMLLSIFVGIILAIAGNTILIDTSDSANNIPTLGSVLSYALIVSWTLLSLYLGPAEVADHCNRMTITIPVSAKTLWLSRVIALTCAEIVFLIITGLVVFCVNLVAGGSALFPPFLAKFLIMQFSCILLLILVIQSLYIERMAMPSIFRSYATLILVWMTAGVLLYKLIQYPIHFSLLPLAGAAIILWLTLSRLPASFSLEPQIHPSIGPSVEIQPSRSAGLITRLKTRWIVWITLFRTIYHPGFAPIFLLGLGILAMANMDYGLRGRDQLTMIPGIWMFLFILQLLALMQLYKLDHLPISRRKIYACLVLPSIVDILIMSIVGIIAARYSSSINSFHIPLPRFLPINLVLILLPWLIMQSFIYAASRASVLRTRMSILTAVCALGYMASIFYRFIIDNSALPTTIFNLSIDDFFSKIQLNTPLVWLLAILALVSTYLIAERYFKTAPLTTMRKD